MGVTYLAGDWLFHVPYPGVRLRSLPEGKRRPGESRGESTTEGISLDANGIIHNVAQAVYAYGDKATPERIKEVAALSNEQLEAQFFQGMGNKLAEIIYAARPRNYIIIAVDGGAPSAKIAQQRRRRYMSSAPEDTKGVALGPVPSKKFDSNCITPGTDFMKRLDLYLQSWIATNRELLPPLVIYSSHLDKGEGEHKIFRFFRDGVITQGTGYHLVFGLDADLVMLASLAPLERILLVREEFKDIISIDALKDGVYKDLTSHIPEKKMGELPVPEPDRPTRAIIIQDFVLMVYFVGNDFVPHQMCFERVGLAIRTMFDAYRQIQAPLTLEDGQIRWTDMTNFLHLMALQEPGLLTDKAATEFKYPSKILDASSTKTAVPPDPHFREQGTHRPGAGDNRFKVTAFNYDTFRTLWYYNALGPRSEEGKLQLKDLGLVSPKLEDIEVMCDQYIFALQWILQYYVGGDISQRFVYAYNHCPLLSDLAARLLATVTGGKAITVDAVLAKGQDPVINPLHQLVAVLPVASIALIPPYLRQLLLPGGELVDLVPTRVIIEREGKDKDWQGIPILPPLDLVRVQMNVDRIVPELPEELEDVDPWISRKGERVIIPDMPLSLVPRGRGRGDSRGGRGRGGERGRGGRGRGGESFRGRGRGLPPPGEGGWSTRGRGGPPTPGEGQPTRGRGRGRGLPAWSGTPLM